jgi:hypothetical protein
VGGTGTALDQLGSTIGAILPQPCDLLKSFAKQERLQNRCIWKAAQNLIAVFRDHLMARAFGIYRSPLSHAPKQLVPHYAGHIQSIYISLVEPRQ